MPNSRTPTGGDDLSVSSAYHKIGLQTALSTQIKIYATDEEGTARVVGAIQSLAPTETRPLLRISEVGTDGVVEIIPQAAATVELAVTRIIFDYQRLPAAFQRGFRHINSARLPFDIVVEDYNAYQELNNIDNAGKSGATPVVTVYKNCWVQNYSFSYTQDNYMISETATIWAEHVYDSGEEVDIALGGSDTIENKSNFSPTSNALSEAGAAYTRTSKYSA